MPTVLQFRRGTTAQNNSFTGSAGELSIDTDLDTIRVHDGSTPGGFALVGATAVQTITNKSLDDLAIVNGIRNGNSNGVGNIGNSSTYFNTAFVKATSAQYADVAEKYTADQDYPCGTVLEISGSAEVQASQNFASSKICGIVSTNPAFIMNSGLEDQHTVVVALIGRVPCRVKGTIAKGDLLCSSDIPGVATRLPVEKYVPGVVVGKALQDYDSDQEGVIEVLVGRL
jgi:hypothetical protein